MCIRDRYYIPKEEYKNIAQGTSERYPIEDVWNGNEYDDLNSIAIVSFAGETVSKLLNPEDEVKGQKSEKLIERIIRAHTEDGDIVLDFFGGTGTTGAVAHKMKRRYILAEQLDKHLDIIVRRLKKVIVGDQSGVSKRNDWQGGGSFVYCELANANQRFVDMIDSAENTAELKQIWEEMQKTGFLSWKVKPEDINAEISEFEALSLIEQKSFLLECLDENLLYVPLSEIDNSEFAITSSDKRLNGEFYDKNN